MLQSFFNSVIVKILSPFGLSKTAKGMSSKSTKLPLITF